jgi:hypothetical protein
MHIIALQGDQVIRAAAEPFSAEVAKKLRPATNLVIAGSHSSPHTILGHVLTCMDGEMRQVRVGRATIIEHADRHLTTRLAAGDYEIYPQRERGGDGDRAVAD